MVHKIFPKTFPKSVSYILLKCLYASHSPGGVPKTAIKFHILHFFLLQLTYTGFSTKYSVYNNVVYVYIVLKESIVIVNLYLNIAITSEFCTQNKNLYKLYIFCFSVTYLIPKVAKHLVINSSLKCVSVKEKLNYGSTKAYHKIVCFIVHSAKEMMPKL